MAISAGSVAPVFPSVFRLSITFHKPINLPFAQLIQLGFDICNQESLEVFIRRRIFDFHF